MVYELLVVYVEQKYLFDREIMEQGCIGGMDSAPYLGVGDDNIKPNSCVS